MARKPRPNGLDIETYNAKRDFAKTKEPKGRKRKGRGDSFVVQKHDASRLHWDFRLELDGVLKSWAVPRGPSLDPRTNRLAMRTEDHPLDYGSFEGIIPQGEYGGGTVMLWDRGRWIPHPDKDPRKTLEEGHLHFTLEGERMKGEWVMFRMKPKPGEKGEAWMLKKVTDDFARPDAGEALVEKGLTSVASDRSMAEIAAGADVWESNKSGKKGGRTKRKVTPPPGFEPPQLATLADHAPTGSGWIHELKYDGYRLLLSVGGGGALAFTRNGKDWSEQFAPLVEAAAALPAGCLLDGEAVALDAKGKPSFQLMQATVKRGHGKAGPTIAYYAFDLLIDRGEDIRGLPLLERKERLAALLTPARLPIIYGDHVTGKGEKLFEAVCKDGGEGIISKRADATYAGKRTRDWLKIKCTARQEFVIVGWQASDKRRGFRSLHLAVNEKGGLRYVGKVGTGFDAATIESLIERMKPLAIDAPPLEVPKTARRGSTWVRPTLVAEIAYTEFTGDGVLRHPSFLGLREDKGAKDVVLEAPVPSATKAATKKVAAKKAGTLRTHADLGLRLTSPDRVVFPEDGLTKADLADYYAAVADLLMVDLRDRPMTLIRCPSGRAKNCFFQKHDSGSMGAHVRHVPVKESDGSTEDYLYVDEAIGALECVQMNTIEFHSWGSRIDALEKPDRLVFDLDPDEGLGFDKVKAAAVRLKELLADLGLETFPLLSGGKGIHVIAPLDQSRDWPTVKSFAERFSRAIAEAEPDTFTANIRKNQRKDRIFLDWLRNQRGATAVLPYSARAREGAPVAVPVAWDELPAITGANIYSIRDARALLERASGKALKGWGEARQALPDL
ncbi:DNA ligase D [Sphingomonas astaxanthinifaciens]|uniref:DNA ligase (ATP) n=1 Tax=Sphingomonas astaxanthinifaciens DSM 22298 TaxID=1123267 RepID=A0ABQ5Z9J4_9SPHN|nr:DNA ligase D [Sphingomonas astaxanthinifaciens]GLR48161.1 ATP-dependent DNA ligase [Sphingomonas astaxanthinifaciens DSM 22298]